MYHCLSKSGSTDWEVTPLPCHTLQIRSKIHNNTLQSKQEIIRIHLHPSAIINYTITRPAKYLLNLTQPHEPLCDIPATQTCNCCLLVVDFSTWKHVKYTENSLKLATNSMSCRISSTFRLLHRLPTTSVLSHPSRLWGPQPSSFFTLTEAPAASSASTTSRRPFAAARCSGPLPRSGGRRWRGDGTRQVAWVASEDFGRFQTYSDMYHCLSKSGSTDWEVTPLPCHTLQTRSKIHNNTLQSKQEIIRIQKHPSAIISNTRPAKCPLNLTQPPEPL